MATPTSNNKLSLLAMYDDMCRFSNSFNAHNDYKKLIQFFKNLEEVRVKWAQALEDLRERDSLIQKLQNDNHDMNVRMQSLRMAFAREVKAKESLQKEYNDLKKKMEVIKDLMLEDKNSMPASSSRTQLMSMLNDFDRLHNYQEDDSSDGLLFDKSDDNIDVPKAKVPKLDSKPVKENAEKSSRPPEIQRIMSKIQNQFSVINEVSDEKDSILNTGFISEEEKIPSQTHLSSPLSKAFTKSTATIKSNSSALNRRASNQFYSKATLHRHNSKLEPERLDSRPHQFQYKKAFKSQICTACNKNIGFCTAYYACTECRGIAHTRCKDLLPTPCLPYLNGNDVRKMISSGGIGTPHYSRSGGKLLMIGDFANMNARPCVPALLIHCCNEIDRRIQLTLKDKKLKPHESSVIGLYRICGVEREVRELRNKILEAKHGIPNLASINDVHTICGAVKMFLRDLEDSLVTTVLWHDFVRASEHVVQTNPKRLDSEKPDSGLDESDHSQSESDSDPINVLKDVIMQMPVANRDSLAFLMLHLMKVANAECVTKMTTEALSNIFAPTIVGNSEFRQVSSSSLMRENTKQVTVMNALFLVSESFWNGLLKDQNFSPFEENRRETVTSLNDAANNCSKLAKISSSNLKALLNEQQQQSSSSKQFGTTSSTSQQAINKYLVSKSKKPNLISNDKDLRLLKKRTSTDYIRQTLY
ncbi:macrophage migration inhibitory factor [Sarcoptes scabiei]|nr:macrophage migration inhibitory factor [Sarcoptes scabiei]